MPYLYRTKSGEMLDEICWKHYGASNSTFAAAIQSDPELVTTATQIFESNLHFASSMSEQFKGVVEAVLDQNSHLSGLGMILPTNVDIRLPDIQPASSNEESFSLWGKVS